jgi:regulator of replication initiation timing
MNPDDIHIKLVSLQEENEKLKKTSVSMQDVEKLIEENRKMKLEIYKLQVTQYGHT